MPEIVVVDSSVIINFANANMLHHFGSLARFDFVYVQEVNNEMEKPHTRKAFDEAKANGWLRQHDLTSIEGLSLYAHYQPLMENGEAASLSLALAEGWIIACDEHRAFRREAQKAMGARKRLYTTAGLMMACIRNKVFDVAEADRLKEILVQKGYKMSFGSFAELIDAST